MSHTFSGVVPQTRGEETIWFDQCQKGRLSILKCMDCESYSFYPTSVCRSCSSRSVELIDADGRGVVHTFSWVYRAPPGFETSAPYNITIVELIEGVKLMSRVLCDEETLKCGLEVQVNFAKITPDFQVPVFVPVDQP
jgi:uncharacterized OB-fold protein